MNISRRRFTRQILRASSALLAAPALVRGQAIGAPALLSATRPRMEQGVASGDVSTSSAVIWSRADRPAKMFVEWSLKEDFADLRTVEGPVVSADTDFTAKVLLTDLPPGSRVFYRVHFEGPGGPGEVGEPVTGTLGTASLDRDVFFAWGGDTCGQGFGIDEDHGGLLSYESIRQLEPEFLVNSGDLIYADNPLPREMRLPDGTVWRNQLTPEKSKVAETLAEFRGNFRYNLLDKNFRACLSSVPMFSQWDDHEVRNNWYPGQKLLMDPRYREKDVDTLAARARQAFLEYTPVTPSEHRRIYRKISRGPLCDLFFLDLRSYRSANNTNRQKQPGPDTELLGEAQVTWLEQGLRASTARWKVICSDMPLGLLVADSGNRWEACANGDDGPPLGREFEIARLLTSMKRNQVRNVFWITTDVHYAAAHRYDPARAAFTEFDPFWEFVSGPLHAGTYGPTPLDKTFGPIAEWISRRPGAIQGLPPSANEQFFGAVRISAKTGVATITQHDRTGRRLWSIDLPPV